MAELDFSQAAFLKAAKSVDAFAEGGTFEAGAESYLETFYDDARQNDYLSVDKDALLELAEELWRVGSTREAGQKVVEARVLDELDRLMICVVMDDQAFLVDSIVAAVSSFGIDVHGLFHPIVSGYRSENGGWVGRGDGTAISESVVGVVIPRQPKRKLARLMAEIQAAMDDVVLVNSDFQPMLNALEAAADRLRDHHAGVDDGAVEEATDFLDWMRFGNFVLLGAREYSFEGAGEHRDFANPEVVEDSQLGVLRDEDSVVLRQSSEPSVITSNVRAFLRSSPPVSVAKSNLWSRVHRRVRMDYVSIKSYADDGEIAGETRFVGLLTSDAYNRSAWDIPLIRRKLAEVMKQADVVEGSHKYNRLRYVLSSYPRDELFQISVTDLARIATSVAQAFDRPRTRVFLRRDPFDRFVSVLVYTPREQYSTRVREKIGRYLAKAFDGRVSAFYPQYSDAPMARVHFIIGLDPDSGTFPSEGEVEQGVAEIVRPWDQELLAQSERLDVPDRKLLQFARAFTSPYRDTFDAAEALEDIARLRELAEPGDIDIRTMEVTEDDHPQLRVKLYSHGERLEPSNIIPIFENFALHTVSETGYPVFTRDGDFWVHDVNLRLSVPANLDAGAAGRLEAAFEATWAGRNEDDAFNRIVLPSGADWRSVAMLRAVAAYRRQTGLDPSRPVQVEALERYPDIARALIDLFHARFDPAAHADREIREAAVESIMSGIRVSLDGVRSLEHDNALRRMADVIATSLRTNFYQTDKEGAHHPYISIKIDSGALSALPDPRPYREIFVSGPRVDGVHLRFGPIARGGLRWSDRRDDFRAEVLGLVKAQQVKNSVIVPVGSKGGFYPKQLPAGGSRDEVQAEAIRAYTVFISGLLDITDTYRGDQVIRPDDTVCWDGPDPYLVVAADKGTATFSDIANGISEDYGFWLGDAFASGGSAGYDHKAMGITARGAWEAVKRHFREMGKDIQTEDFTVIGIGDMSGDVFGNGMLLSEHIKLVAAFNHLHIFVDPDPDPAASFAERKRLFEMGRSSWTDYDTSQISEGGGIFERSAKSIELSEEIKAMTGLTAETVTPDELIHALLKTEVELLWFGGIGTYIKAGSESDMSVRDKANDAIRVDASEVRAKVVGEGANLGVTQAGRIAFARRGGRINTDAVDNSAGVDSSDHEVNIKILLGGAIEAGALESENRNDLLESMTDEVASLVLQHNIDQTAVISLLEARAEDDHAAYGRFMRALEADGALDRAVEGLPSPEEMAARSEGGLTRPEIAVLVAYAKIELYKDLIETDFDSDDYYDSVLENYFPDRLSEFEEAMDGHRLRKEIIASRVVNLIVDTCGPLMVTRLTEQARADIHDIADAFMVAYGTLGVGRLLDAVAELDNEVDAGAQIELHAEIARVIERVVAWQLRVGENGSIAERIARREATLEIVDKAWLELLSPYDRRRAETRIKRYERIGIDPELATDIALLRSRASSFDVIALAERTGLEPRLAAHLFYAVGSRLKIDRVRAALLKTAPDTHWDALALRHLQEELFASQGEVAARIAADVEPAKLEDGARGLVGAWVSDNLPGLRAYEDTLSGMLGSKTWSVSKFSIVSALLAGLRQGQSHKQAAE